MGWLITSYSLPNFTSWQWSFHYSLCYSRRHKRLDYCSLHSHYFYSFDRYLAGTTPSSFRTSPWYGRNQARFPVSDILQRFLSSSFELHPIVGVILEVSYVRSDDGRTWALDWAELASASRGTGDVAHASWCDSRWTNQCLSTWCSRLTTEDKTHPYRNIPGTRKTQYHRLVSHKDVTCIFS